MRLFVALALPAQIVDSLTAIQSGVPGARWLTREQMHLTLRFIGECDGREEAAVDDALHTIAAPSFPLVIKGVGEFGGRNPNALWAGVESNEALLHLQRKIESALQRVGLPAEARKFTPHITLARLRAAPRGRVMDFLSHHGLFKCPAFDVSGFVLYSSHLSPEGSVYRAEKAYRLR
jgi:RNA 2',3'-cyclic 3'-phosphodiesterase